MAIFHLSVKTVSRAKGQSAVASAAYRAGTRLRCQRTGRQFNFARKRGVAHAEIILPEGVIFDREALWNAAERAETRCNATVAREFEIALPAELSHEDRVALALSFGHTLMRRYHIGVDICVHAPNENGDSRNHHAHIQMTTRVIKDDGSFGPKVRILDSQATGPAEIVELRQICAEMTNAVLAEIGVTRLVDHRSHAERGINKAPGEKMGVAAVGFERRTGEKSDRRKWVEKEKNGSYQIQPPVNPIHPMIVFDDLWLSTAIAIPAGADEVGMPSRLYDFMFEHPIQTQIFDKALELFDKAATQLQAQTQHALFYPEHHHDQEEILQTSDGGMPKGKDLDPLAVKTVLPDDTHDELPGKDRIQTGAPPITTVPLANPALKRFAVHAAGLGIYLLFVQQRKLGADQERRATNRIAQIFDFDSDNLFEAARRTCHWLLTNMRGIEFIKTCAGSGSKYIECVLTILSHKEPAGGSAARIFSTLPDNCISDLLQANRSCREEPAKQSARPGAQQANSQGVQRVNDNHNPKATRDNPRPISVEDRHVQNSTVLMVPANEPERISLERDSKKVLPQDNQRQKDPKTPAANGTAGKQNSTANHARNTVPRDKGGPVLKRPDTAAPAASVDLSSKKQDNNSVKRSDTPATQQDSARKIPPDGKTARARRIAYLKKKNENERGI